jgi:hypothetical protein
VSLDPKVFEKAADYIEKYGWYSQEIGIQPLREGWDLDKATCISLALGRQLGKLNTSAYNAHLDALCKWFKVKNLSEIYKLNDNQPDYETGKKWALDNLRGLAASLR